MSVSNQDVAAQTPREIASPTVEEYFNQQIKSARQLVESLCIKKAKLETLGLNKHPYFALSDLINTHPF